MYAATLAASRISTPCRSSSASRSGLSQVACAVFGAGAYLPARSCSSIGSRPGAAGSNAKNVSWCPWGCLCAHLRNADIHPVAYRVLTQRSSNVDWYISRMTFLVKSMAIPAGLEPATLCLEVRRELRKLMKLREFCFTRSVQKSLVLLHFCQGL